MVRNLGHLSPHSFCGLTTKIKIAENTSRRRSGNVLDYSEVNALSCVVLYNTSKSKKTLGSCNKRSCFASCKHRKQSYPMCTVKIMSSDDTHCLLNILGSPFNGNR